MNNQDLLNALAGAIDGGGIRVVDLSQPLRVLALVAQS